MRKGQQTRTAILDQALALASQAGLVDRTPRGRIATPAAYKHFGFTVPKDGPNLFDGA